MDPLVEAGGRVVRAVERQGLDEDLDSAAAGEPDLPRLLVAEVQLEQARAHGAQDVFRFLDDLRIDAPADRHRADDVALLAHNHLGAFLAGRGAVGVDQGGHGHPAF